jgi:hypothetical protein
MIKKWEHWIGMTSPKGDYFSWARDSNYYYLYFELLCDRCFNETLGVIAGHRV